uniref:OstA-like protein n=1 Tax=Candidatus Cryptobacteroides bacterium TaxID=3085639 RepID=UPI004026F695
MLARRLAYSLILLLVSFGLFAQNTEQKDSLVRLLGCDELQQVEEYGQSYRKALGHARFEHNSTLLICDTALWNVNQNVINAFGNVQIIQNNTVLSSESLDYLIDQNLAQFRGALVQLRDKDGNTLRTTDLDYNTKDSVAVFRNGGALRDKDGQIIESDDGHYYSKLKTFSFTNNVNMYTDSIFVKTDDLDYNTGTNVATFGTGTNAWRDNNMLSSQAGFYERTLEKFTFFRNVHILTENQEAWADTLVYYRVPNNVEMFGHVELLDTTRNVAAVAGYVQYIDSLSFIKLTREPAVIAISEQGEKRDTAYIGADTLILRSIPKCDVDSSEISNSASRLKEINVDPVTEYRRKAYEAAKAAAEEARKKREEEDPNAAGASDRGASAVKPGGKPTGKPAGKATGTAIGKTAGTTAVKATGTAIGKTAGTTAGKTGDNSGGKAISKSGKLSGDAMIGDPVTKGRQGLPAPWDDVIEYAPPRFQLPDTLKTSPDTVRVPSDSLAAKTLSAVTEPVSVTEPAEVTNPQSPDSLTVPTDSLTVPTDSLTVPGDSLHVPTDSLSLAPKDSTKISFIYGIRNVKVFRNDMQVACDSLAYTDLDSLIRLYENPIVWNEIKRQYSADSITVIVKNRSIDRASLMSNAFIIVQEDTLSYDQIRGTEMMAYFDSTGALRRFDSMGGASGVFYIEENGSLATVNKFESKMLTATLKDGNIQDLNYFDAVKTDAYPVVQMKKDEKILKGFDWQPDKRPKGPEDITPYKPRESQRKVYENVPRAEFAQTDIYFPGHMNSVYKMLARQDSLKRVRNAERRRLEAERKAEAARIADSLRIVAAADSLALADSLARADSLALRDSLASRDSLARQDSLAVKDSLVVSDSLSVSKADSLANDPSAIKKAEQERKKAEREKARKDRQAAKEARWAELDARDAAKAKAKEEKALKKKRQKTLKTLKAMEKRRAKEERMLERYKARYEKQKARKAARKAGKNKD